jgi:pimeloyl-ACP methyl ester carboxylesterase
LIHGNAGGFDQGLNIAQKNLGGDYQTVIPSRFGYLRTPLPEGATLSSQVDAYDCLLDSLDIDQTAVIAYSAGGPSAVQFALRYPERTSALIMISTAIADDPLSLPPRPVIQSIFGSDFLTWLITDPLSPVMRGMFVPRSFEMSPTERAELEESLEQILPSEPRQSGIIFDMYVTNTHPYRNNELYDLGQISTPTLIINAKDDPAANYNQALAMSEQIPNSRFVSIPEGGHLLLGSGERVRHEIEMFLQEHHQP